LTGGADDSDNVRALPGSRLGLGDIFVNIPGGNNNVNEWSGMIAKFKQSFFPDNSIMVDFSDRFFSSFFSPQLDLKIIHRVYSGEIQLATSDSFS
jgi:hypothetical protein